jgi:cytochrome c oxidase accessory protein FixG
VFSRLREQVCTTICPYGRLQGVLLDKDSIVVAYDYKRGEGRAKFRKGEDRKQADKGDCIDCNQCVVVCPTGIDIRNGTQLECINCTVCMDACDSMMDSVGLDKGLIRYASENEIAKGLGFRWTARMIGYIAVLVVLFSVMTYMLTSRNDVQAILLRVPGTLYQKTEDGSFQNIYTIKLLNKTNEDIPIVIKNMTEKGKIIIETPEIILKPQDKLNTNMSIIFTKSEIEGFKQDVEIGIYSNGKLLGTAKSTFIGPMTIN